MSVSSMVSLYANKCTVKPQHYDDRCTNSTDTIFSMLWQILKFICKLHRPLMQPSSFLTLGHEVFLPPARRLSLRGVGRGVGTSQAS